VTPVTEQKDKAEEESQQPRPKKPPGYRKFEKLLKQVVNAPPMRKKPDEKTEASSAL
jgi:hypothetical protein